MGAVAASAARFVVLRKDAATSACHYVLHWLGMFVRAALMCGNKIGYYRDLTGSAMLVSVHDGAPRARARFNTWIQVLSTGQHCEETRSIANLVAGLR